MTRWQYCEVIWQPIALSVTEFDVESGPLTTSYEAERWPVVLAELGANGWEMVSCSPSPVGAHEYYFYFKRAFAV